MGKTFRCATFLLLALGLFPPVPAAEGPGPRAALGLELLRQGEELLGQGHPFGAASHFADAQWLLDRAADQGRLFRQWSWAAYLAGDRRRAVMCLRRVLTLDPGFTPAPDTFPGGYRLLWRQVKGTHEPGARQAGSAREQPF